MNFFSRLFHKIFDRSKTAQPVQVPPQAPVVVTPVESPPAASGVVTPKVVLGKIACEYDYQEKIIRDGFDLMNRVFQQPEFKRQFMAFKFVQTNGMTNQQIWDLLCSKTWTLGADLRDMGYIADHVYHTVGLDDASDPTTIFMNSYFVGTPYMVCDNGIHELMHVLGFSHINPTDYTSVPYGMNTVTENTLEYMHVNNA